MRSIVGGGVKLTHYGGLELTHLSTLTLLEEVVYDYSGGVHGDKNFI